MVEKTEPTEAREATETLKPGDSEPAPPESETRPAETQDKPTGYDPEVVATFDPCVVCGEPSAFAKGEEQWCREHAVNGELLADLPLPAFQRITSLSVGAYVAAVETTRKRLLVVRGEPLLYAFGAVPNRKSVDVPAEVATLSELCKDGRGGHVFHLDDLLAEMRSRRKN